MVVSGQIKLAPIQVNNSPKRSQCNFISSSGWIFPLLCNFLTLFFYILTFSLAINEHFCTIVKRLCLKVESSNYFFSIIIGKIIGRLSVLEYKKSERFSIIAFLISLSLGLSVLAISFLRT